MRDGGAWAQCVVTNKRCRDEGGELSQCVAKCHTVASAIAPWKRPKPTVLVHCESSCHRGPILLSAIAREAGSPEPIPDILSFLAERRDPNAVGMVWQGHHFGEDGFLDRFHRTTGRKVDQRDRRLFQTVREISSLEPGQVFTVGIIDAAAPSQAVTEVLREVGTEVLREVGKRFYFDTTVEAWYKLKDENGWCLIHYVLEACGKDPHMMKVLHDLLPMLGPPGVESDVNALIDAPNKFGPHGLSGYI